MAFYLPQSVHEEVFLTVQRCFGFDFPEFNVLVAANLRHAIAETNQLAINVSTTKLVAERYYDVDAFNKTSEHKALFAHISIIFKAAYVLLLSYQVPPDELFTSVNEFLAAYPEFRSEDPQELQLLLNFRNVVKVALMIIPARLNKEKLLKIAGRLEGGQLVGDYITGGGQKKEVARRVQIYEKEGGCSARKRAERKRKTTGMDDSASSTETTTSHISAVSNSSINSDGDGGSDGSIMDQHVCVGQPLGETDGHWVGEQYSMQHTAPAAAVSYTKSITCASTAVSENLNYFQQLQQQNWGSSNNSTGVDNFTHSMLQNNVFHGGSNGQDGNGSVFRPMPYTRISFH